MIMKYLAPLFIFTLLFSCGGDEDNTDQTTNENQDTTVTETVETDADNKDERKSPRVTTSIQEGGMDISFDYGSPRVRDRVIWGDLVPYDKVWRAGADEVSAVTFNNDVILDGNHIKAGTYGMFIIPKENKDWTFILNEEWSHDEHGVWGAYDYKKEKDVLRIDVSPETKEESEENLTYSYDAENNHLLFWWEKILLKIPVAPADPA